MTEHDPRRTSDPAPGGHSRRDFLRGSSLAAASAVLVAPGGVAVEEARADEPSDLNLVSGEVSVTLTINGEEKSCQVEPRCTLLDTLRHRLDITGPKRVCDRTSCGACTVILDGETVYACTTLAITCEGKTIETLESFDTGEGSVPHAFHQHDGLMCGYCTPGLVTACKALLDKNPNPSLEEIKQGLDGNICRCGTYIGVFQAALDAARALRA